MNLLSNFRSFLSGQPSQAARRTARRGLRLRRRAAMTVEFALVAGIYMIVVFTMFEVGRLVMIHQILTEASRAGARRAVLENATEGAVKNHVAAILTGSLLDEGTVSVSPTDLSTLGFGDPVTVTVSVRYADVSWIGAIWVTGDPVMSAQSMMRAERPE